MFTIVDQIKPSSCYKTFNLCKY